MRVAERLQQEVYVREVRPVLPGLYKGRRPVPRGDTKGARKGKEEVVRF